MRYHLLAVTCIASLALIANPASAQKREYTPGLNYTTLGNKQANDAESAEAEENAKPEKPQLYNSLSPKHVKKAEPAEDVAEGTTDKAAAEASEKPKEDPTVTIWNKYKDIAAGTAGEKDNGDKQATKTPSKPEKPAVDTPTKPSAAPTEEQTEPAKNAFGTILDEWKSSRDKQREMRSKTFAVPDAKSN